MDLAFITANVKSENLWAYRHGRELLASVQKFPPSSRCVFLKRSGYPETREERSSL
jgi:hypothetical protein